MDRNWLPVAPVGTRTPQSPWAALDRPSGDPVGAGVERGCLLGICCTSTWARAMSSSNRWAGWAAGDAVRLTGAAELLATGHHAAERLVWELAVTGRALQVGGGATAQRLRPRPTSTRSRRMPPRPARPGGACWSVRSDHVPVRPAARPGAQPPDGPWASRPATIADRSGLVIVACMFTPAADGRVYKTPRAVGRGVDARYDKVHLFDAFGFRESGPWRPAGARG